MARNVIAKVQGKKLILEIDLSEEGVPSSSGKTLLIATTQGNADVPGQPVGWRFGLNVWKPNK